MDYGGGPPEGLTRSHPTCPAPMTRIGLRRLPIHAAPPLRKVQPMRALLQVSQSRLTINRCSIMSFERRMFPPLGFQCFLLMSATTIAELCTFAILSEHFVP